MPKTRKVKPATVKDMARRRGLSVHKAISGGWYVVLVGTYFVPENPKAPNSVLYATHDWKKAKAFIKKQPMLIKREGVE